MGTRFSWSKARTRERPCLDKPHQRAQGQQSPHPPFYVGPKNDFDFLKRIFHELDIACILAIPRLTNNTSDLKQYGTEEKTSFSCPVLHGLS